MRTNSSNTLRFLTLAAMLAVANGAYGQTAGGATASLEGPVVAGVCYLSREAVFSNAAAGKDAGVQLQKLVTDAQAEIERDKSRAEAELIRFALSHYRGQMSEVARRLGIGRSTLYRKMKDYGLGDAETPAAAVA